MPVLQSEFDLWAPIKCQSKVTLPPTANQKHHSSRLPDLWQPVRAQYGVTLMNCTATHSSNIHSELCEYSLDDDGLNICRANKAEQEQTLDLTNSFSLLRKHRTLLSPLFAKPAIYLVLYNTACIQLTGLQFYTKCRGLQLEQHSTRFTVRTAQYKVTHSCSHSTL